jgi:stage II sporulation protein D
MISTEPVLAVGIIEGVNEIRGAFRGIYSDSAGSSREGEFRVRHTAEGWEFECGGAVTRSQGEDLRFAPSGAGSVFRLDDVTIGISFHWERKEPQVFHGALRLHHVPERGITAINEVPLEEYLKSVISSEMSATAPSALLQAHAITSRSWLVAMLERRTQAVVAPPPTWQGPDGTEIVRWYTREDHHDFDVCADDHCQRYHGVTKIISAAAAEAVEATRGVFLVHGGGVCDARFYKSCGGRTEDFSNAWEDAGIPYLRSILDGGDVREDLTTENGMQHFLANPPAAYCNTTDADVLRQVLPSFDQETMDFFRWEVIYPAADLDALVAAKSGLKFGRIRALEPLHRGPSGRITRLKIVGTEQTVTVGKELEIRRWLSKSHLYSSAFVVETARDSFGLPTEFRLRGAGWGHGVGLCQIGAAVMATQGIAPELIVLHYFPHATLQRLY